MLAQHIPPAVHGGEEQSSAAAPAAEQRWSINPPQYGAKSLADLAQMRQFLRPGNVVYVTEVRPYILTEADLNTAARTVIGGAK